MESENISKNISKAGVPVLNVGNPGNKGGPGRPKSEVVAACRQGFDERIPILTQIAEDPNASQSDRLKAIDLLGKYGQLQHIEINSTGSMTVKVVFEEAEESDDEG